MKSVRPVGSTRLKAPGDMEENMVSKISKPLSSVAERDASRHVLNRGSFMSNKLLLELGVNVFSGAVEAEDGTVELKPFERF